jgi:hypothetical protein
MLKLVVYKITTGTHRVNDYTLPGHILYTALFSTPHTTFWKTFISTCTCVWFQIDLLAILDTRVLFTASLEFNLPDLLFPWEKKRAVYSNNPHTTEGARKEHKNRANSSLVTFMSCKKKKWPGRTSKEQFI